MKLLPLYFSLILSPFSYRTPQYFTVTCTKVVDGDSLEVSDAFGNMYRVRLGYIDAPEYSQYTSLGRAIGREFSTKLRKELERKQITLKIFKKDYYGRYLSEVFYQKKSVNLRLIKEGRAYIYPYSRFESLKQKKIYLHAKERAKKNLQGLWKFKLLRPWSYRKKIRKKI